MRYATTIEFVLGWWVAGCFLCLFALVLVDMFGSRLMYTPYVILGSVTLIVFGLAIVFRQRAFAKLQAVNMMLCPFCRYDLQNLRTNTEDGHWRCPECGSLMDKELVTRLWTEAYKPKPEE